MFTAVYFCNSQDIKQPKHPSTNEWIKKIWLYTHTHIHTQWNAIQSEKKNDLAICNNMDITCVDYAKWNVRTEKDKHHMILLACEIFKNNKQTKNLVHRYRK